MRREKMEMENKNVFKGRVTFNIEEGHPDIQYVENVEAKLIYEDTYTFNLERTKDDMIGFIKNDLSIVAGGGYNSEHISNVSFNIEEI